MTQLSWTLAANDPTAFRYCSVWFGVVTPIWISSKWLNPSRYCFSRCLQDWPRKFELWMNQPRRTTDVYISGHIMLQAKKLNCCFDEVLDQILAYAWGRFWSIINQEWRNPGWSRWRKEREFSHPEKDVGELCVWTAQVPVQELGREGTND